MSRTGKKPIEIVNDIQCKLEDNILYVIGPFGTLSQSIPKDLSLQPVRISDQGIEEILTSSAFNITKNEATHLILKILKTDKKTRQLFGLFRTLINNMILGVSERFTKELEMKGVGYKAQIVKNQLSLSVGFSHPVNITIPEDIEISVEKNVNITLKGSNKEKIGLLASQIQSIRPPEPYKGKGILYKNQKIKRKAGKSAK